MRPIVLSLIVTLTGAAPAPAQQAERAPADRPAARQPQADPLPSADDVRKRLAAGDAVEALKQVNRLLALRGQAAEGYDRYELLCLKADAHLELKATHAAVAALRQAAGATDDPQQQAVAKATELLIKRSKNLAYTPKRVPKGGKAEPISIVEPESRRKALAVLFVDEVAPLVPKVESAKKANGVAPMVAAMAAAREVRFLERAANGSADQVNGMIEALADAGEEMLGKVVERATKRVDRITTLANETEHVRQVIPTSSGSYRTVLVPARRGVRSHEVAELKNIIDACDEVLAQAAALAEARGEGEEVVEDLTDSAEDLKVHVQRMLRVHNLEYTGRREDRE